MTRCFLLFLLILNLGLGVIASHLSIHDIVHNKEQFSPQQLKQLQWLPGSHEFSYVNSSNELIIINADNFQQRSILLDMIKLELKEFPEIHWINQASFWFSHNNIIMVRDNLFDIPFQANTLAADADNIAVFSPQKIAYTVGPNLYLSLDNTIHQLTNYRDEEHILNGHVVHRQEFGIDKGIFWSPSGTMLAYYRMDESMVDDYPFFDIYARPLTTSTIKYPMAGRPSHQVKLIIYNLNTKEEIAVDINGPLDQYLTNISWHRDEQSILVNILNREQNHIVTNAYDIHNGQLINTLWEFKADKYINPAFPFYFAKKSINKPLWCSRHEGFFSLYEMNIDTHILSKASNSHGDISACLGFSADENLFFFTASDANYPAQHGYSYNPNTGTVFSLTASKKGSHAIIPSSDGEFILDIFSSLDTPYQVDLITNQGTLLSTIFKAPDPLLEVPTGAVELLRLQSAHQKYELFGRILYPPNFDSSRKYPAIVYVYGGPHVQLVKDTWLLGARLWEVMMAQKGYIVFSIDNRGSMNRGLCFEQESYCHLGVEEIEDQMQGVSYLKSLDFVDAERLGVFGWSFGGYMSASLMLKKPGVFKAGVAGGAVTDWQDYEIMYGERFMKKPDENPQGYQETKLSNFVQNLAGDLLLISGTHDDVVVPSHTQLLSAKAVELGKEIDTFYYSYGKHHFNKIGETHMYNKITKYFDVRLQR